MKVYKKILFLSLMLSSNIKAIDIPTILEHATNEKTLVFAGSGLLGMYCLSLCLCNIFSNPKKTEAKRDIRTYLRSLKDHIQEIPSENEYLITQIEFLLENIKRGSRGKIVGLFEILNNSLPEELKNQEPYKSIIKDIGSTLPNL